MLISSCSVVERTVTGYGGKAKIIQIGEERRNIFPCQLERGQMDHPSLHWRGKSSSGSEVQQENSLVVQVLEQLCPALTSSINIKAVTNMLKPPKKQ